jgi:hypothetical protein
MFTGFASQNTPSIKVWDYSTATKSLIQIALTDDCAPIQVFVTGASTNTINLYLPSAPIEGKIIKFVHALYGTNSAPITIISSDSSATGSASSIASLNAGQTLDLCYSKDFISRSAGFSKTGWISLNMASISATNQSAVSLGFNNIASGQQSASIGGIGNTTNYAYASTLGGTFNTASGDSSSIIGGSSNNATAQNSFIGGGSSNTASGNPSCIVGSGSSAASGTNTAVVGGNNHLSNSSNATVVGGSYGTSRAIIGNTVLPASLNPIQQKAGVQQLGTLLLGVQTTDATATVLRSNNSAAGTTNQVILPNNSAYYFKGTVVAGVTGGGNTKGWTVEGVIKRGANAASTAIVGTATVTSSYADAGASTWVITATADTTNGGLAITVTGQAATTIRWVAQICTTEMTY